MSKAHKIIWAEGILLTQQHFQQWEFYHQQQNQFIFRTLRSHAWGLIEIAIDEELLSNGVFKVQKCKVLFQSGLLIQYDSAVDPLLCYQLNSNENQIKDIYLCLPLGQKVSNISGYSQGNQVNTWLAEYHIISDIYDHNREQEVLLAKPNLILLGNHENRNNYESIKIAEIIKNDQQKFKMVDTYYPPLLNLHGSQFLQNHCERCLAFLNAKELMLKECYQRLQDNMADNYQAIGIHLILLQAIACAISLIQYYMKLDTLHPSQMYLVLSVLISKLSIFDPNHSTATIPTYDHGNLFHVFNNLNQDIKMLFDKAIPSPVAVIMLRKIEDTLYVAENIDSQYFHQYHFYIAIKIAVNSEHIKKSLPSEPSLQDNDRFFMPDIERQNNKDKYWADQIQNQIKISAFSMIKQIAALAISGVKVVHMQRLPGKLSIKPGFEYYYLTQTGEAWDKIKQERSLALFIPHFLTNATIELMTIADK